MQTSEKLFEKATAKVFREFLLRFDKNCKSKLLQKIRLYCAWSSVIFPNPYDSRNSENFCKAACEMWFASNLTLSVDLLTPAK